MRRVLSVLALVVMSLLVVPLVMASYEPGTLTVDSARINGDTVELVTKQAIDERRAEFDGEENAPEVVDALGGYWVEEGETLNVRVALKATGVVERVRVNAEISGYEYGDIESLEDSTHVFDIRGTVDGETTRHANLEITLPKRLERDRYLLRLRITDQDNTDITHYVVLAVNPVRHGVGIDEVTFSPYGNTVKAGRSLLTIVSLQNFGDFDEDNVRVTVEIPELGLQNTEYTDVETDDHNVEYEQVRRLFLPIPATAAEGDYEVRVTARFDEFETVTKSYTVHVTADERFSTGTLVLAVGPESQNVAAGKTASYAVALTNAGAASKAYTLSVVSGDWATATLSDSLVVLEPGRNKVVYVDVAAASSAASGEHVASLVVSSGDEVLDTIMLKATVTEGTGAASGVSLRNGLEIALIVLVVLLVIIGLIIGFSRLKKDEEEEQTYY
jgi:uncharacterized membrane protein